MKPFRSLLKFLVLLIACSNIAHAFYDPGQGRWLSRDPIAEQGGLNLYGFVDNDGVNRRDVIGMFVQTLFVDDKEHSATDRAIYNENVRMVGVAVGNALDLRMALEAMTDEDFEKKTKNGIYAHWFLESTGLIMQEAESKEVQVGRTKLIEWMKHEETSDIKHIQTYHGLKKETVFEALNLFSGDEEYPFDSVQIVIHGMVGKGARIGDLEDRIPYQEVRNVLDGLQYFESRALSSCGANCGFGIFNRIISIPHRFDEKECKLFFTPAQAGHDYDK